jgi:SAM-dependent methyltransferase
MHPHITYDDLDWHTLWQNARAKKSWTQKGPADWDKKAASFAKRNRDSAFVNLVLSRIPYDKNTSVLDAGSGPGTLSLPLAPLVKSVCALDYSKGMLSTLDTLAAQQQSSNIKTVLASWEDDWDALHIGQHDICIASRSLSVANLKAALAKLNNHARRAVFVVDRINPTPFDQGAFVALNRPFRSGPDYIYTINTLYSMGIHPCVEIISLEKTVSYSSMESALDAYTWMFKDLNAEEEQLLARYIEKNSHTNSEGELLVTRSSPARWALIWWNKE